jgi:hypothetical protein
LQAAIARVTPRKEPRNDTLLDLTKDALLSDVRIGRAGEDDGF